MKNIYHVDIYKIDTPVSSYCEDNSRKNLNLENIFKLNILLISNIKFYYPSK